MNSEYSEHKNGERAKTHVLRFLGALAVGVALIAPSLSAVIPGHGFRGRIHK